ncbi:MAG: porin [Sphingobacteriales bacterium]
MKISTITLLIAFTMISTNLLAQNATSTTSEDSLNNNNQSKSVTTIGGYGNVFYQRNSALQTSKIDLERFVLFTGHKFNDKISFFSELEVEDAKVAGGESGGEVSIEQAYLKFNLNANQYLMAGLFLPRIGILNEDHLPNTFNGNERNYVETFILPSTWRELGVGFYGRFNNIPLNYSVGLVNGLSSAMFEHGDGIREGRFEGKNATANNLALTAALQYYQGDFKFQVSGYYGGAAGVSQRKADSLGLNAGTFGTPVAIGEADMVYSHNGWQARVLGTIVSIPDAANINRAYANNTPQTEYGAYAEIGYDVFHSIPGQHEKQLIVFVRDEKFDVNASIPSNGVIDETLNQNHVVAGFTYLPIRNVAIKADVRIVHTGAQNPNLIINPNPAALAYQPNYNLVNLGIALSF